MSEIYETVDSEVGRARGRRERKPVVREQRMSKSAPAPAPNDELCDAILAVKFPMGSKDEVMKREAREVLGEALSEEDKFEVDDSKMFVGNKLGMYYGRLTSKIEELEREVAAKNELAANNVMLLDKVDRQEFRIECLKDALQSYRHARQRFVSTFKRDKLKDANPADHDIIHFGSEIVHGGDAHTDAGLYSGLGRRADVAVYQTLYGFLPERVEMFSK